MIINHYIYFKIKTHLYIIHDIDYIHTKTHEFFVYFLRAGWPLIFLKKLNGIRSKEPTYPYGFSSR